MNLPAELLEQLIDEFASKLARLLAPEVAALVPAAVEERWRLWTLDETAAALGRSERWVRERVKRGNLAFIRLDGGALAFLPADVVAFAEARRVAPVLADRLQVASGPRVLPRAAAGDQVGNRRVGGQ